MPATEEVKSIEKAIKLINTLAASSQAMSLQELSNQTGFAKSTIHRLLATLRANDMVEQSMQDGRYQLGIRLFELGCAISNNWNVAAIARPYMQNIANELNESVCLAVLSRGEALIMSFLESTSAFHVVSKVGSRLPAHCTVQGKILLSYLSSSQVRHIIRERGMQIYTPHTIHSIEALEAELHITRERGYAIDNSEFHIGLHSVAAPILNHAGEATYSIAVVSMFHSVESPEFQRAMQLIIEAAADISHVLGH
ncbi:MAG TPA: IclR family transcriptional regulator [Clostridia bacterium]|nr:IclR family transcriptional regulator [Clostridia bacterium]